MLLCCSILLYFLNVEYHVKTLKNKLALQFFYCSQILILLTQLTAVTAFETCTKRNSACCNYLLIKHTIHNDQIFYDEIDHKYCVKNLLRFLTKNIARILQKFCYITFLKIRKEITEGKFLFSFFF